MTQQRKYFGTDGIRGKVGDYPITPDFVLKLGWAAGRVLGNKQHRRRVLIGKDTRISGYMLESALEAGLSAAGMHVRLLGPMPTPGIAYLTRTFHASAGIVVSASHNPFQDNGIKFFSHEGFKLPDEVELAIEAEMDKPMTTVAAKELGKAKRIDDAAGRYIEFCKSSISTHLSLTGLKLVVDCAHGATYHIAPNVFLELGAEVIRIGAQPDGLNINQGCGATHTETLQAAVQEHQADLGIALDGDGDRLMMVDSQGREVDGDEILFIIAKARQQSGKLSGPVVGTLMSNFGLEQAFKELNIPFLRAKVGDRYVIELLRKHQGLLGGESSGHIICLNHTTTGDGIITALQVLAIMVQGAKTLQELCMGMEKCPQQLINVALPQKQEVLNTDAVRKAVAAAETELAGQGRVLLRPSGTEPLIRVMVEGRDITQVKTLATSIADTVHALVKEN
ncbi:phosphoglucosamine mutase [Candidatus Venteria ishoeyi]|uniref:phosphoglucosamine mutase n=1 Tax=Candidatus Venteria ishoeyi TaxID=1899563 RepID=UPI0025A6218C|nr:phosphoglucosamine mutase [Candidatus Venteria ishoeyi]MDM8546052.1 phosphoglucosamine mutase [Candidatus Venteria ishoeyi]